MKKAIALNRKFKLGLCINPFAGIGGALALKGSDGSAIREKALAAGAKQEAMNKAMIALQACEHLYGDMELVTGGADMGENICKELKLSHRVVYRPQSEQTESDDTSALVQAIVNFGVDLLLFAGGDGTARNICEVIHDSLPVLGVPAGCKIHSGVFAITPNAAGKVLAKVITGELLTLQHCEVKDIDEISFRQGKVIAKHFGEMKVPEELHYIQAVKMGGKESDELLLDDISDYIIEIMQEHPNTYFVMGSGSTVAAVMEKLGLKNTLLGVDLVKHQQLVANDLTADSLLSLTEGKPCKIIMTVIGGQGHILGRGNQQLSVPFIRRVGKENMLIIATKSKLRALGNKGLISDSGDASLDHDLAGPISIISGYKDHVLYFIQA